MTGYEPYRLGNRLLFAFRRDVLAKATVSSPPRRRIDEEGWRKLHSEERHNLYCSQNITRVIN
jgi:hypothetical protein